ncbi:MAG: 30S ribosomal protein S18 [Proteobacteria bacterium]|nr:30S ribosomal protein S18 [Pseudomonadota bacterium]
MRRFTGKKRISRYNKPSFQRRRVCRFCGDKSLTINYKNTDILQNFVTERGKIIARRISGNCAKHQRQITKAIKIARNVAIIPFTSPVV